MGTSDLVFSSELVPLSGDLLNSWWGEVTNCFPLEKRRWFFPSLAKVVPSDFDTETATVNVTIINKATTRAAVLAKGRVGIGRMSVGGRSMVELYHEICFQPLWTELTGEDAPSLQLQVTFEWESADAESPEKVTFAVSSFVPADEGDDDYDDLPTEPVILARAQKLLSLPRFLQYLDSRAL